MNPRSTVMAMYADMKPIRIDIINLNPKTDGLKVYEGLEALPAPSERASVTIGAFDGIHRGHQALIRKAVEDARAHGRPAVVLTFDRHPSELFRPESAPKRLSAPSQRKALIASLGVDVLIVARFDNGLADKDAGEFMTEILKRKLGAEAIVEGEDFCFGRDRTGNLDYLLRAQDMFGFAL